MYEIFQVGKIGMFANAIKEAAFSQALGQISRQ